VPATPRGAAINHVDVIAISFASRTSTGNPPTRLQLFRKRAAINRATRQRCRRAGLSECMKRINTMSQFLDHLADDVMFALIEKLSETRSLLAIRSCDDDMILDGKLDQLGR
jgi:hypothetical protein